MANQDIRRPPFISFSTCFALATAVAVLALLYYRLYFGVEFSDEAFYVAIPFRFVLGDRPFIDEMSIAQTMGFISYPFLKLFYLVSHSTEAVVLFMRHLFFAFYGLIGWTGFRLVRKFFDWQTSLVIALTAIVFIPFNITNLSYNTLGMGFFAIGCFLLVGAALNPRSPWLWAVAGFAHALSVMAYPSRFLAAVILVPLIFLLAKKPKIRPVLLYGLGYAPVVLFAGFLVLRAGGKNLHIIFDYFYSLPGQGQFHLDKIVNILRSIGGNPPDRVVLLPALAVVFFGFKKRPLYFCLPLVLAPLAALRTHAIPDGPGHAYIVFFALLAPYFYALVRKTPSMKAVFYGLWAPSFVSGLIVAFSSGNGFRSAAIGFFPAGLIMAFFAAVAVEERLPATPGAVRFAAMAKVVPALIVLGCLAATWYPGFYREDPYPALTAVVKSGPYKGIRTSPEKHRYLEMIAADVAALSKPGDRLLFYDRFPAGYLLTDLRAATDNVWLYSTTQRSLTVDYFQRTKVRPDLVFRMKRIFYESRETNVLTYPPDDALNGFIDASYEIVVTRPEYDVLRFAGNGAEPFHRRVN